MKRIILTSIVLASLFGLVFFGIQLSKNKSTQFEPHYIFSEKDSVIIKINRVSEIHSLELKSLQKVNSLLINEIKNLPNADCFNKSFYIGSNSNLILVENKASWNKDSAEDFTKKIKLAGFQNDFSGKYLVIYNTENNDGATKGLNYYHELKNFFLDADKKASVNVWKKENEQFVRTDIYALNNGLQEYKTHKIEHNLKPAVDDISRFSSVIPENIKSYSFKSTDYLLKYEGFSDSLLLFSWLNKGMVKVNYLDQDFYITDTKSNQNPTLILLEHASETDSVDFTADIKYFYGLKLTTDFPVSKDLFITEIEDKVLFFDNKELAEKVLLSYNLGETLALNKAKKNQLFGDLTTKVHRRKVSQEKKYSLTFRNKVKFEVSALPPGEIIMRKDNNWSFKAQFEDMVNLIPIKDHIRGGYSLFAYNEKGKYNLISQAGELLFEGDLEEEIIGKPITIDMFENDKMQILFSTPTKVYAYALNGEFVNGFPYQSEHKITAEASPFRWTNNFRSILGNEKGEIIMINHKGGELNIIKGDASAIKPPIYAVNKDGMLRAWYRNKQSDIKLGYLETPALPENLNLKIQGKHIFKNKGKVIGFIQKEDEVYKYSSNDNEVNIFAPGQLFQTNSEEVILKQKNELQLFDFKQNLLSQIKLAFNEIGFTKRVYINGKYYLLVHDYLENNVYLYNNENDIVNGFPKEARELVNIAYDKNASILNIYTLINDNILCYKMKFE